MLLDSALGGHGWADHEMCESHAGALFCLARAVLDAGEAAETVVVGVVADACTRPGLVSPTAARPRVLLALCAWGAHTYRQAGALMGLPASAVLAMLGASLQEVPQPRRG